MRRAPLRARHRSASRAGVNPSRDDKGNAPPRAPNTGSGGIGLAAADQYQQAGDEREERHHHAEPGEEDRHQADDALRDEPHAEKLEAQGPGRSHAELLSATRVFAMYARAASASSGAEKWWPCPYPHPASRSASRWAAVSTPSAMTPSPRRGARARIPRARAEMGPAPSASETRERSSFTLSSAKRWRALKDARPRPKSSRWSRTPRA